MGFQISTSRVPHGRGETFETLADAMAAVAELPGVTLADIVPVRTGTTWEDQAAVNDLADARRAAATAAKAAEDEDLAAAQAVALAEAIQAREPK